MLTYLSVIGASPTYYAYDTSDPIGKGVVIVLLLGSVLAWTIMIEKGISLHRARKASEDFIIAFRKKSFPLSVYGKANDTLSPVSKVYLCGARKLMDYYGLPYEKAEFYGTPQVPPQKLTTAEIEAIRTRMEREVSDQILTLEERMGLLATAVSASPLLGLFGTVWGIMLAFCSLAEQGRTDIAGLAPGVSGALLTTVVGLVVAIPSLLGYNLLTLSIRKITVYMDNFVEEIMAKVKLEQFDDEDLK